MKASVIALILACTAVCAWADPVQLSTWYEFSFLDAGTPAAGCFDADPSGQLCIPSSGTPTVFADAPPWTFTAPADGTVLTIVDAFLHGDAFQAFDFGALIGVTLPNGITDFGDCGDDPVPCLADPLASKGFFFLDAGGHSLTITPYESALGGGSAYFRIDVVPEPPSALLLAPPVILLFLMRLRRTTLMRLRRTAPSSLILIVLTVISGVGRASAQPANFATIAGPADGSTLSGIASLIAIHSHPTISPLQVSGMQFEVSTSGSSNWSVLGQAYSSEGDGVTWVLPFDTTELASGAWYVRAREFTSNGLIGLSPPIRIVVDRAPIAVAQASFSSAGGTVHLNGTGSSDPDGSVVDWMWDFGDGTTGSGATIDHVYSDASQVYEVSLTVTDDEGVENSAYLEVNFPAMQAAAAQTCVCKSIDLRGPQLSVDTKMALGPNADGKKPWKKGPGYHGMTLGPLADDPGNPKREYVGFAFEALAEVEGDPSKCKEIQVVKRTAVVEGFYTQAKCVEDGGTWDGIKMNCTVSKSWTGSTADLDKDGTDDIDVSNKAKCEGAGGKWEFKGDPSRGKFTKGKCTLFFPKSGAKYGPDIEYDAILGEPIPGGAYESPSPGFNKAYAGQKIITFDAPVMPPNYANGSRSEGDFIFLVRGTDKKYCYVAFSTEFQRGLLGNTEKLTITGITGRDKNVAAVPGVP